LEWYGETTQEEVTAFLTQDRSYVRVIQRNQEAQEFGLPVFSDGLGQSAVTQWPAIPGKSQAAAGRHQQGSALHNPHMDVLALIGLTPP
jgi:hypothetical protein